MTHDPGAPIGKGQHSSGPDDVVRWAGTIPVPEGEIRAWSWMPVSVAGPWPAVIFVMDGFGARPALFEMAERLASNGYYVLMPDMFWRLGSYPPADVKSIFSDPQKRSQFFATMMGSTNAQKSVADIGRALDWIGRQPAVDSDRIGMVGYCMGGGICLRAAAAFPDRVAAVGAFHAGNIATDQADSPHRLLPQISARILVAGADSDPTFSEEACAQFRNAADAAGCNSEITIYRGALHGYAPSDTPVFDPEASERHWRELLALLKATIA